MAAGRVELLSMIRNGRGMSLGQQLRLSAILSGPAILAQLSSVMMQYIDASMVGHLGAAAGASIGLVSTCTWLMGGFAMACCCGFSVQVAHYIGADDFKGARSVMRQGLFSSLLFGCFLSLVSIALSGPLPGWIGGSPEINPDASAYFLITGAFMPFMQTGWMAAMMLQGSGNMRVPSILNVLMCVMDVGFNYLFIYGLDMGVKGAALGTGMSELITCFLMLYFLLFRSRELGIRGEKGSFIPTRKVLREALSISLPMFFQNIVMRGAHVATTVIVAPLGTIAIAANAFAVTAESFCYMPGYGIADAATSLVGQSLGAGRKDLAKRFAAITSAGAMAIMTFLGILMYIGAPWLMGMLTPDPEVISLGVKVLRIEAFAETLYAASIAADGAFMGAGDTLVPSIMNFGSMWLVRVIPAIFLTRIYGLQGFWIAMCIELNFRGIIFLIRLGGRKWMSRKIVNPT